MEDEDRILTLQDEIRLFAYLMSGSLTFAERISAGALTAAGGAPGPEDIPARTSLLRVSAGLCLNALEDGGARSLEPFPDELVPESALSVSRYEPREIVSLEFAEALQALRSAPRALLILCDVLGLEVKDAAGAGKGPESADLSAAREALAHAYRSELGRREPPPEEDATALMMRYIFSCETAAKGHRRLLPTRANGQLAFGVYDLDDRGRTYTARSIQVVYFSGQEVSEVVTFEYPFLFKLFQLPDEVIPQGKMDA